MLRRVASICILMVIGGIALFYAGMAAVTPYAHSTGKIGILPVIGGGLFLLGIAGALACFSTWLLTTMVQNPKKDKE